MANNKDIPKHLAFYYIHFTENISHFTQIINQLNL